MAAIAAGHAKFGMCPLERIKLFSETFYGSPKLEMQNDKERQSRRASNYKDCLIAPDMGEAFDGYSIAVVAYRDQVRLA